MRVIAIIFGFVLMFNYLFNLQHEPLLANFFPIEFYQYPQARFGKYEVLAFNLILGWAIPILLAVFFVFKAQINKRYTVNYGINMITAAVAIYLLRLLVLYLTTFVQGGGATFVTAYLFGYLALPLKLMVVVGVIKLLLTLNPRPERHTEPSVKRGTSAGKPVA